MNIADVIGWKFSHQEGMRCKEIAGVMTIVKFPGGIPSQEDQDSWTAEYNARDAVEEQREETYNQIIQNNQLLRAIVKAINKGTLVTGANKTGAELKAIIKAQMNGI